MRIIVDADGAITGRLASFAAKKALEGNEIVIVNSEKALISGKKESIKEHYLERRRRHGSSQKGQIFPSAPERILKRTIRGMLPHKEGRGKEALERIRCYSGIPKEYEKEKKVISAREKGKFLDIKGLSKMLKAK